MRTRIKNLSLLPALTVGLGLLLADRLTAQTITTLHSFAGYPSEGSNPQGGLILSDKHLYGTALQGGSADGGTVFKVNTDGTGFTTLYDFAGGTSPVKGLILSGNPLYGTAGGGGLGGTVFAVNTDGTGFASL